MSDIWTVFAIIGAIVVLFMWDRIPVIAVCIGAALAMWATGILTINQALSGFGDPAVVFIASLFVVSAGLEVSGVTAWAGQLLIKQAGASRTRLIVLMMGFVSVLCALISLNGAVAALLRVVIVMAIWLGRSPSQLLMPLVFGADAGSKLMLTGSPVNVLVVEAAHDTGARGFSYFEFALIGIPLLLGCIAIVVLLGEKLLPHRTSATLPPDLVRRQAVPMGPGAQIVLAALAIMVFLLATGLVPPVVAGLISAGIILISGVLTVDGVCRAINWTTVILVGALTPLSIAMQQTGAAALMAEKLVGAVGESGPYALLAGLFVFSAIMGQVISNTATSLIVIPIAVVAAQQMGVSVQPVLMCVGIACAGAFLTPVATPTNLMVMEPGAYKFGDYWKLGLPMMIWFFLMAVFLVPLIWPF
ncbi:MAG: hypothetical protein COW54_11615 [Rhodobacteraceae bacterium CG17_big_fil_post_rev_8_21_14_2_50_63_15]|nr:MAG: hypothetical protein COW54_11615 [Rhodobacteraceae bacterium CG17_big_fil_post_rev_8_21_14_2_50_63_15]